MGLAVALSQMFIMFIVVVLGYAAGKLNYLNEEATKGVNGLIINVALPCMIIGSVTVVDMETMQSMLIPAFIAAFIQPLILLLVGVGCNYLFRTPKNQRALYVFMNLCINTGFLGIPVIQAIYGNNAVLPAIIFVTLNNLYFASIGFMILDAKNHAKEGNRFNFSFKTLINVPLITYVAALIIFLTDVTFPPIMQNALEFVGGICPPLAMMVVGAILSRHDLKRVFLNGRMYGFVFVRQLIAPLICFFVMRLLGIDELLINIFVLMFAMPVGSMVPAFAETYKQDGALAASGTALSTVLFFFVAMILISIMSLI